MCDFHPTPLLADGDNGGPICLCGLRDLTGYYRTRMPFRKNILEKSSSNMHAENTLDNFWLGHCLALDKFEQTASSSQTSASSVGEKDTNPVDWVVVRSN